MEPTTAVTPDRPHLLQSAPPGLSGENSIGGRENQDAVIHTVERFGKEWLDEAIRLHSHDRDFAIKLSQSATPHESIWLCSNWLNERIGLLLQCQHKFLDLWMNSVLPHVAVRQFPADTPAKVERSDQQASKADKAHS